MAARRLNPPVARPRLRGAGWGAYTAAMSMPRPLSGLVPFVLALALSAAPAQARALLLASDPAANAAIAAGPTDITLRFSGHIDPIRSHVSLIGPHGTRARLRLAESHTPGVLAVRTDLIPGAYVLHWRVLGDDGHFTSGTLPFTANLDPRD